MQIQRCDGTAYQRFLIAGTYFLRKYRAVINDLNVFPVPDGDTGTNMFLTARQAMLAAKRTHSNDLSAVAAAAAQGALIGARGNSGVLLAQMLRGFARGVEGKAWITTADLFGGLAEAALMARRALVQPVEGTMLSVASAAAEAAANVATEPDFLQALDAIACAASGALELTPEQLPLLKEAGVVDAGGQGFLYFLEGAARTRDPGAPFETKYPRSVERRTTFTQRQKVETHRFCTEFVVLARTVDPKVDHYGVDADALRQRIAAYGDSLIVAGGEDVLHVHIHTDFPARITAAAGALGSVQSVKVDDMEKQHESLLVEREMKPRGIVYVAPGEGFARICRELGANVDVRGGPTANPSVGDLVDAIRRANARIVYVLPNDKNVVLAAREAARLAGQTAIVIPTRSAVEGIAALFELQDAPDDTPVDPEAIMQSIERVASGSIFIAARDATLRGVAVKQNELVGAMDARDGNGEQLIRGEDAPSIAVSIARAARVADGAVLITLYYGAGLEHQDAEAVAGALRAAFPRADVETYYGGQASSEYLISIER